MDEARTDDEGCDRPMTASKRPSRGAQLATERALGRGGALVVSGLLVGIAGPALALVLVGQLTDSLVAMYGSACLVTGVAGTLTAVAVQRARRVGGARPWGRLAALVGAVICLVGLVPSHVEPPAGPVAGLRFWQLETGSRIAYVRVPAHGPPAGRRPPLLYLHGGPGVSEMADAVAFFGRLAQTGRDVYVYDQLGAGRSGRLVDPRGYAVDRAVADLEAIRRRIHAAQVGLIGHSWGATLAAAYMARHRDRVERVALSSPATLVPRADMGVSPVSRLSVGEKVGLYARTARPRSLAAYTLTITRPAAARAFAGDAEMDRRFSALFGRSRPGLLCDGRLADRISVDGVGHYANQLTAKYGGRPDPLPALRHDPAPALVLHGPCDYERHAGDAAGSFPHARFVEIPGAGHQTYVEQPRRVMNVLETFFDTSR